MMNLDVDAPINLNNSNYSSSHTCVTNSTKLIPLGTFQGRCGCVRRPTLDLENLDTMDCASAPSPTSDNRDAEDTARDGDNTARDGGSTARDEGKLTVSVRHPLQGSDEAWLLPTTGTRQNW